MRGGKWQTGGRAQERWEAQWCGAKVDASSPAIAAAASTATATAARRRGFKALKQIIKIQSRLGDTREMVDAYRTLLQYAAVVTRNAAEKKINSLLDFVSSQATDTQLLQARVDPRLHRACTARAGAVCLCAGAEPGIHTGCHCCRRSPPVACRTFTA